MFVTSVGMAAPYSSSRLPCQSSEIVFFPNIFTNIKEIKSSERKGRTALNLLTKMCEGRVGVQV